MSSVLACFLGKFRLQVLNKFCVEVGFVMYMGGVQNIFPKKNAFKIKKRLLLRCIHHFKSDLMNNMDNMRISGTEPSSVILSQTK